MSSVPLWLRTEPSSRCSGGTGITIIAGSDITIAGGGKPTATGFMRSA
jgi:hypothetical protein